MAEAKSTAPPAPPNTRETRALALYRERHDEIECIAPDVYLVPACSARGGFYKVDYEAETCTCPDAEFHSEASCKHVLVVGILRAKHRRSTTYRETVEAARMEAATEYRREIWAMANAGTLDEL